MPPLYERVPSEEGHTHTERERGSLSSITSGSLTCTMVTAFGLDPANLEESNYEHCPHTSVALMMNHPPVLGPKGSSFSKPWPSRHQKHGHGDDTEKVYWAVGLSSQSSVSFSV